MKYLKYINAIIVLILSISQLPSQTPCRYSEYDDLILSALDNTVLKKYEEANEAYGTAFLEVAVPFSVDLLAALEVAKIVKDSVRLNEIAILLAKGGIPLAFFEDFRDYGWYPYFKSQFEFYRHYHESHFDLSLKTKLLALRKQDSIFNHTWHEWKRGEKEMSLAELIVGAKAVTEGFEELVTRYGFPCEKRMGYYYQNKEVTKFPVLVILIHIYQRGVLLYKESLSNFVCYGDLSFGEEIELESFRGFGNSTGVEQEMRVRYEKFKKRN
ncbi:MAG: hypothetical protein AB8G15_16095 [Saprospiraceae bacterium]